MFAFCQKTKAPRVLRLFCASLLIIAAMSGCSRLRGAKLYIENDSAHPVRVRLLCAEGLPQHMPVSVLLLPHSEQGLDVRLEEGNFEENSYDLEVFNTGESSTSLAIPQELVAEADGGEIRVVLGSGEPRFTASPDRDVLRAQRVAFRFTVAFLAAFASVIYWSKYWRRRRA